jgi:hypothetical protein
MKKGLVLALALLTVFAFVGCGGDSDEPGVEPAKPFEPPADWKGLNQVAWEGKEYVDGAPAKDIDYTAAGVGSYNVTIKTRANYSAIWFNFQDITYREGWYVSLSIPDTSKLESVWGISMTVPNGNGTSDISWDDSQNTREGNTGDPLTPGIDADGNVVNDVKLLLEREARGVDFYGIALQFYWIPTITAGEDFTFTINMIKVKQFGTQEPPEPPYVNPYEGWENEITKSVDLGDFTVSNNDNQKGWATIGMDGVTEGLTVEELVNAEYLILELNAAPAGGFQIVWQGDGTPGWAWNQQDILSSNGRPIEDRGAFIQENGSGTILGVKLSDAFADKDYEGFKACTQAKIYIAYYTGGLAGLGLQKAYLALGYPAGKQFDLGALTAVNGATQQGWATNGQDGVETELTTDILIAAKYLVLELSKAPTGGMQIIWQGNGNNPSDWNQQDDILTGIGGATDFAAIIPGEGDAVTLSIKLSKAFKLRDQFEKCTQAKFFVAYYSSNVADLGITNAYLLLPEKTLVFSL